jgi:stage V sporulation protein R
MNLTPELERLRAAIAEDARNYGLDFYETVFELLDYDHLNEVASYLGFPTRYPHWRFGMEYERLSKSYSYGLSKIYELVINNDPCYAYLMKSNALTDQKMVMAHVYGHCDFFKNNLWFSQTNRKMVDQMANHATRLRRYIDRFGLEPVELFLDSVLSLENLIDQHSPFIQRREPPSIKEGDAIPTERMAVAKLRSKEYMDEYINPVAFLERQRRRIEEERARQKRVPESPQKDVLLFLIEHAPLEEWQADILSIVREEAYYFAPQAMTKIMNEGWASYWHSTIMTERQLQDAEVIDYADHHSGTMGTRPGVVNPYKIGLELFRDIEDRWNKGKFGREYEECTDWEERRRWDKKLGLGRDKIFEVRRVYNDVSFIDAFLTPEFCEQHRLFTYGYDPSTGRYVIVDRDSQKVKQQLLFQLTNYGDPFIYVVDANYENRGELYLFHRHEGMDLRLDYARDVLVNLSRVWKRPVNLETIIEGKPKLLGFDGSEQRERSLDEPSRIRF